MPVGKETLNAGAGVDCYTLSNEESTLTVKVLNYGGILQQILVPDRNRIVRDVTLGFDTYEEYTQITGPYFGALTGRFANR